MSLYQIIKTCTRTRPILPKYLFFWLQLFFINSP